MKQQNKAKTKSDIIVAKLQIHKNIFFYRDIPKIKNKVWMNSNKITNIHIWKYFLFTETYQKSKIQSERIVTKKYTWTIFLQRHTKNKVWKNNNKIEIHMKKNLQFEYNFIIIKLNKTKKNHPPFITAITHKILGTCRSSGHMSLV
jgi:hypothetical protein